MSHGFCLSGNGGLWQAKCTIIRETNVYKAKTMVLTINLG